MRPPFASEAFQPKFLLKGATTRKSAFTLLEMMIAIGILALILTAIYASWTAILRASKTGLDAAASVQRSRIALRALQDSLGSAMCFSQNHSYYGFIADNGSEASLSFVSRLSKSFPRGGRFGDLDVRRVTFSVEQGRNGDNELVLRQSPLLMEPDIDEKEHPLVLAKHVKEFSLDFWDGKKNDWTDEWKETNQLPRLVKVTLKLSDSQHSIQAHEVVTRLIPIAANAVPPLWQMPRGMNNGQPQPGQTNNIPGRPNPALPGQQKIPIP